MVNHHLGEYVWYFLESIEELQIQNFSRKKSLKLKFGVLTSKLKMGPKANYKSGQIVATSRDLTPKCS